MTVLIVDDDLVSRRLLEMTLTRPRGGRPPVDGGPVGEVGPQLSIGSSRPAR